MGKLKLSRIPIRSEPNSSGGVSYPDSTDFNWVPGRARPLFSFVDPAEYEAGEPSRNVMLNNPDETMEMIRAALAEPGGRENWAARRSLISLANSLPARYQDEVLLIVARELAASGAEMDYAAALELEPYLFLSAKSPSDIVNVLKQLPTELKLRREFREKFRSEWAMAGYPENIANRILVDSN